MVVMEEEELRRIYRDGDDVGYLQGRRGVSVDDLFEERWLCPFRVPRELDEVILVGSQQIGSLRSF